MRKFQISLEAARVNAKMTQREAADAMETNVSTIQNWESGKTIPRADQFVKLCDLYAAPMDAIFLPS